MPRKKTDYRGLVRRAQSSSPLVDAPPLGHLQVLVLHKLGTLGRDAFGLKVLEKLSEDAGVWLDAPDVYSAIKKLVAKELIELTGTRPTGRGPPVKIYKVTAAGRAAMKVTAVHYNAVADQLNNNKR